MTGFPLLDGALIAVSLFNTILLMWLGLTVLLNAERRTWGVWVIGFGMLVGAGFFVSHTAILGEGITLNGPALNFWWKIGWIPVIVLPFAWYVVMLWYAGYWNAADSELRARQRRWLKTASIWMVGLGTLMILGQPLPSFSQIARLDFFSTLELGGVTLLFVLYPDFMMMCIMLSIDALRHPGPADRPEGERARQRAHPWLLAASVVLMIVAVLVAAFIVWALVSAHAETLTIASIPTIYAVGILDLLLAGLIGAAVILLGQALVSYEVFTGKVLPRRGFFRHWRNVVIFAAGYSLLLGWALVIQLRPIYSLMLTTIVMVVFYVLFGWRSFVERERFMARLRPFVTSQRLIERLTNGEPAPSRAGALFQAICRDVLGAARARLIPMGVLAPLAGPPLLYPPGENGEPVRLSTALFPSPQEKVVPIDPNEHGGFRWAIPLWAERGLIGALLLGDKRDGGLYPQEEIEIARASGERIVDMLAGEQMARRLVEVQRRRVVETRVIDLQTRRVLHDEVLPALHASVLTLGGMAHDPETGEEIAGAIDALTNSHRRIANLIHQPTGSTEAMPAGRTLIEALREVAEDEFGQAFDSVTFEATTKLPELDPLVQEAVFGAVREAIRNAAVHAQGKDSDVPPKLAVTATRDETGIVIAVRDDGIGFESGNAPSEGGSGGGLALHSTMMAVVGGYLTVESPEGGGTLVTLTLPPDLLPDGG